MPGTIAVNITDISEKISPVMKRIGIARTNKGESTSPKMEITIMIIVP